MKNWLILALSLGVTTAHSAEVDSFTNIDAHFEDISEYINTFSNDAISKAVTKTNQLVSNCNDEKSEKRLYKELTKYFSNHTKGKLVKDLLSSESIYKIKTPIGESVYSNWKSLDGRRLGSRGAKKDPNRLSPQIRVGSEVIGIDKLEHMFGMGQIYFKGHYLKERNLKRVLKNGIFREKFFLGGQMFATGVFSFGDLAANFNGMRFWNHMLLKNDDVLGKKFNLGPYIKCSGSKFVVNTSTKLDFKNYVDSSMNESINCPKFARKSATKKFKAKLESMAMTCPMSDQKLEELKENYSALTPKDKKERPISHWILNTEEVSDVSFFNEF